MLHGAPFFNCQSRRRPEPDIARSLAMPPALRKAKKAEEAGKGARRPAGNASLAGTAERSSASGSPPLFSKIESGVSIVENAFRMNLRKALLLRRLLFLGHYGRAEMRLRGGDAAAEFEVDADVGHRHLRSRDRADNHEVVEIAEMADAEHLAGHLR